MRTYLIALVLAGCSQPSPVPCTMSINGVPSDRINNCDQESCATATGEGVNLYELVGGTTVTFGVDGQLMVGHTYSPGELTDFSASAFFVETPQLRYEVAKAAGSVTITHATRDVRPYCPGNIMVNGMVHVDDLTQVGVDGGIPGHISLDVSF